MTVKPRPANVLVVNDVLMGGGCAAWARWKTPDEIESGPPLQLWVRGRWSADCGADDIAYVAPPAEAAPRARARQRTGAADRRAAHGRRPVGRGRRARCAATSSSATSRRPGRARRAGRASSLTPVGEVLREMNKTSNNEAARNVLLSLAPGGDDAGTAAASRSAR